MPVQPGLYSREENVCPHKSREMPTAGARRYLLCAKEFPCDFLWRRCILLHLEFSIGVPPRFLAKIIYSFLQKKTASTKTYAADWKKGHVNGLDATVSFDKHQSRYPGFEIKGTFQATQGCDMFLTSAKNQGNFSHKSLANASKETIPLPKKGAFSTIFFSGGRVWMALGDDFVYIWDMARHKLTSGSHLI